MQYPLDELYEKYPHLRSASRPSGFLDHLDRRTYCDEIEYLETPGLPLETQFSVVDSLSKLNRQSGYTKEVLKRLGRLLDKLPHKLQKPFKILDIGVGGGGLLSAVHHWAKKKKISVELYGMDISEEFIQRAKKHLDAENIRVNFILLDACKMKSIADSTFDIVLSNHMVHHIRCILKVGDFLSEVYRTGKSWLIIDFQRRIMGTFVMRAVAAPFFPPRVLIEDGIKSIRRAYRAREVNMILEELKREGRVQGMLAKPLIVFPYWIIEGLKTV